MGRTSVRVRVDRPFVVGLIVCLVRCSIFNVRCSMFDVRCSIGLVFEEARDTAKVEEVMTS